MLTKMLTKPKMPDITGVVFGFKSRLAHQLMEKPIVLVAMGFSLFFVTRRGFAGFWCGAPHRGDVKINAIMEIALRSKMLTEIAHENRPQLVGAASGDKTRGAAVKAAPSCFQNRKYFNPRPQGRGEPERERLSRLTYAVYHGCARLSIIPSIG